jgi:hypothetical protein
VRQPYIHCASIHTIFYNPKAYKSWNF